jgi:hypothetical protein
MRVYAKDFGPNAILIDELFVLIDGLRSDWLHKIYVGNTTLGFH